MLAANASEAAVEAGLAGAEAAGTDADLLRHAYCGQAMDDFHTGYLHVHGYLSLAVCFFGCIANTLNIIVLTRREMRSPTNAILTGLAVADLLVMLDYIPYAIIANLLPLFHVSREHRFAYSATWFVMLHSIFAQICHTISIWLTVTLAIWRYIAVAHPQRNRLWCGMRTTLIAIASSYLVCPFIGIPLYLSARIAPTVIQLNRRDELVVATALNDSGSLEADVRNVTIYRVAASELGSSGSMHLVNLWIYSVAIKLIPCVALTILSQRLIAALLEAKRRRKLLTGNNATAMRTIVNGRVVEKVKSCKNLEKEKQTDRTTRMLLAVLLLFLCTEFPQGILGLLSAVLAQQFFMNCYLKLGDFLDLLALLNSAINFILYCSMSRQFRLTFAKLFRPRFLDRWLPVGQNDDDDDHHHNGCRTDGAGGKSHKNGGGGGGGDGDGGCGGQTTTQVTQV